jgi:hypothetical protein
MALYKSFNSLWTPAFQTTKGLSPTIVLTRSQLLYFCSHSRQLTNSVTVLYWEDLMGLAAHSRLNQNWPIVCHYFHVMTNGVVARPADHWPIPRQYFHVLTNSWTVLCRWGPTGAGTWPADYWPILRQYFHVLTNSWTVLCRWGPTEWVPGLLTIDQYQDSIFMYWPIVEQYCADEDLLGRVPGLLLILGSTYITVQLMACLMVTEPPVDRELLPQVAAYLPEDRTQDLSSNPVKARQKVIFMFS